MLGSPLISLLFWILICFSIAALFTKRYSIRPLIVALILRSIYYLGIGPTLNILGALNVSAKGPQPHPSGFIMQSDLKRARCLPLATALPIPRSLSRDHYRPEVGTTLSSPSSWTTQGSRQSEPASQEPLWGTGFRAAGYPDLVVHCPKAH